MRDFSRFSEDDYNNELLQVNWELVLSRQQNVNGCIYTRGRLRRLDALNVWS